MNTAAICLQSFPLSRTLPSTVVALAFDNRCIMPFSADQKRIFDEAYSKACKLQNGDKLVSLMYLMLKIAREANMGRDMQVHPKQMGIHPKNRSGKKMVPTTMQKKGNKITNVGFAKALCGTDRAVAFEVNPMSKHIEDHTIATTSASKKIGKYSKGMVIGGSCGCGHLNQWLAAVGDGAETSYADLCDNGETTISKHLVTKGNVEYDDAIQNGIVWFMLKWELERDYKELPSITQRGLNVEHHVGEGLLTFIDPCRFYFCVSPFISHKFRLLSVNIPSHSHFVAFIVSIRSVIKQFCMKSDRVKYIYQENRGTSSYCSQPRKPLSHRVLGRSLIGMPFSAQWQRLSRHASMISQLIASSFRSTAAAKTTSI